MATEIDQLRAAGVTVLPFVRSSDEIETMSTARKATLPFSPIYARQAQRELRHLLREHRPDVLHLHNPYPLLSPWVVRTAHRAGVPVVQTVHNYRQICVNGVYFRNNEICTACAGRRLATPAVVHGCYRGSRAQSVVMAGALAVHRSTWHSVDRYLALTEAVADHLRSFGIADDRIVVKPNSIPDPLADLSAPSIVGTDGFTFVGRLSPEKGVALLMEAWRRHPVGSLGPLRVVGDGPLRPLVEQAAAERSDVVYLGSLDQTGVREAVLASRALVIASVWHDVLPTVIIEALALGRPVLGTNLGGIPFVIGSAGWTVDATAEALAAALPRAHAAAPALATTARERYLATFHPDVVVEQLMSVYRELARPA